MNRTRILAIDDSLTIRKTVVACLSFGDYDVSEAENGQVALEMARKTDFSLFIVDYNMPVMNGLEFIKQIRKVQHYAMTAIFVLTTESEQNTLDKGMVAGANAWIIKPFKPEALLKGVRIALSKQELTLRPKV